MHRSCLRPPSFRPASDKRYSLGVIFRPSLHIAHYESSMLRITSALLLCIGSMAPLAHAEMFRCSTPEGKTSYQDQPCALKTETQKIIRAPTAQASQDELDPVLAAVKVGSTTYMIEKMAEWCASKSPSTLSTIQEAKSLWRTRHESLIAKGSAIIKTKLSYVERLRLVDMSKLETSRIISSLEDAGSANHQRWCADLPMKMAAPELDLTRRPTLVKTLTSTALP